MREVAVGNDEARDHHRDDETPREVGDPHGLVRRKRRQRQGFRVHARPVADTGEDQRPGAGGDETRQKRLTQLLRRNASACGRHLEQEKRGDERTSEERSDRRECPCENEQLRLGLPHPDETDGDRAEAETERDERRLRSEDEPEPECRERGQQDARQIDRAYGSGRDAFERRVAAVARQAHGERDEDAREAGYENHVPACGLGPSEMVRHDVPHEMDEVVDRGLEERGGEGDRKTQDRGVHERAQVGPCPLVHGRTLLSPPA